jgi:hypothetical protein
LVLVAALAISSSAIADDWAPRSDFSRFPNSTLSSDGHLRWRPYRPADAPRATDETAAPNDVQRASHDEPLTDSSDDIHRDSSVIPVQRLAAADPMSDPFNDQKTDNKDQKAGDKSPAQPMPGPAPAFQEPSQPAVAPPNANVRESAPAKLPGNDPFQSDTPAPGRDNAAPMPPPNPPTPPGNGISPEPKTPAIPPAQINPMPEVDLTTGKEACDKKLAELIANTVDKVQLDIRPKLGPTDQLPGECTLGDARFDERDWSCLTYTWKAAALCHKPLYFEEANLERYGHSRGPVLDPLVSAAHFFVCVPLLPYEMGVEPPCECVYSLGYYRPGSCAPWIIDGFPISIRGIALECTAATGAAFAIP